ncbi:DUF6572 domain-containing protein [Paraflavitalea pollutisoli]|uniref:DUF6572 domain-containing protein n=1 Tax=Paraflavitalea pollutisoli TaxID=3034143 RepID=UPI0023EC2E95|nr:DUF6572 domain-containing protein [Paraflavitalea sp. H1-2-19X]
MSVVETNVIDFASIDPEGAVVLTITDHLEWDDKNHHLLVLQEKINTYISAIEGQSLYEQYPKAQGRKIKIQVSIKYTPNEIGKGFLQRVEAFFKGAGV